MLSVLLRVASVVVVFGCQRCEDGPCSKYQFVLHGERLVAKCCAALFVAGYWQQYLYRQKGSDLSLVAEGLIYDHTYVLTTFV